MKVVAVGTALFQERDSLSYFIAKHIPQLHEGSVLAITSKIVALAEGRTAKVKNKQEKERLIRRESDWAIPTKHVMLTLKDGMLLANAGIDESNGNGKLVLLPKDSFKAAAHVREQLMAHYKLKKLGVLITDSRVMPLRAGVTALALGYAGFKGLRDYRGKRDLFGRKFVFEAQNIADSLATAAALVMGEGSERCPLAIIEKAPVEFTEEIDRSETKIPLKSDLYQPLLPKKSSRKKKRRL